MAETRQARTQVCPNCQSTHDIGVYVTGQKLKCRCGIHFEVRRTDVSMVGKSPVVSTVPGRRTAVAQAPAEPLAIDLQGLSELPALALAPPVPDEPLALPPSSDAGFEATAVSPKSLPLPPPVSSEPDRTFITQAASLVLPGYELLHLIGRGGMGEVWKAHQKSLGRTVAVKVLPPKLAKDPEFIARFEKEATALAALNHPHIVQIIDRGVAGEHYYFAMEYVPGRSLREILNAGRLPPVEALGIIAQICGAIDYAHGKQIIHRDLKPENILVDEAGQVKVADFGLAGIGGPDSKHQLTATSVAMGTVNYMAPEQRKDAKHVDHRADLYSVGVMLYELVTGELPIGRFKLPSEKLSGLDPRLDDIVARSLETEPAARYQRASDLGADLAALLGSGAGLPAGGAPTRPGRSDRMPAKASGAAQPSVIERGWKGIKIGLMVVGALVLLAALLKLIPMKAPSVTIGNQRLGITTVKDPQGPAGAGGWPVNTQGELYVSAALEEAAGSSARFSANFDSGKEEMNAHAGTWELKDGKLWATQAGNQTGDDDHLKLIPRAYFANRYFTSDELSAEVQMQVQPLEGRFPVEQDSQQFGELAFRIKDLQVSVFAIPEAGMRLGWRYFTPDGVEQAGNSARDFADMVEDEMPVPRGTFRVKLVLKKKKNAVDVEAFVNGQRFAHKALPGLEGQTGKIALGCRNLHCEFDDLQVYGRSMPRPALKRSE
ncbi:MAG: serine/threonine-protein kinase [Myxococcaceae bacterium]